MPQSDDPQAEKFYELETHHFGAWQLHRMPLKQLRKITRQLCARYKVPRVNLFVRTPPGSRTIAYYDDAAATICLHPKHAMNLWLVLHELAHHIQGHLHPRCRQDHGPVWVRIFIDLLDQTRVVPAAAMRAACRKCKIRY